MSLSTDNPEKGELLRKSAHHRQLLEDEVKLLSERSEKILTNALVIGGALALTYFLATALSGDGGKKKSKARKIRLAEGGEGHGIRAEEDETVPEKAGIVSQIGAAIAAQATAYLLSVAREKIVEFLESQSVKKEDRNEHS